ncbi:MAG: hypothetical protein OEQ39_27875 [Gammaproteobacteria bacterium]|nr:hypothetical protein [Gammaproteobacteria bacterium]
MSRKFDPDKKPGAKVYIVKKAGALAGLYWGQGGERILHAGAWRYRIILTQMKKTRPTSFDDGSWLWFGIVSVDMIL